MKNHPCRLTIIGGLLDEDAISWLAAQLDAGVFGDALVVFSDPSSAAFANLLPALRVVVSSQCCACCGSKSGLVVNLREILRTRHSRLKPFDCIILEAGGGAEIEEIAGVIEADPFLGGKLKIAEVVVVLTGTEDAGLFEDHPLLARQIESADCVVFTRHAPHPGFAETLRCLNPAIAIFGAQGV